jgi:hypothetical protein
MPDPMPTMTLYGDRHAALSVVYDDASGMLLLDPKGPEIIFNEATGLYEYCSRKLQD